MMICNDGVIQAGYTSLLIASFNGHSESVTLLLEYGANVHAKNEVSAITVQYTYSLCNDLLFDGQEGKTSLYLASQYGYMKVVEILLASGGVYDNNNCMDDETISY